MINLGKKTLAHESGDKYVLNITIDDAAIMKGTVSTTVKAVRIDNNTGVKVQIEATLKLIPEKYLIRITFPNTDRTIDIKLAGNPEPFNEEEYDLGEPDDVSNLLDNVLNEGNGFDIVENIVDCIPVEPTLGCLLKAGIAHNIGTTHKML